MFNVDDLIINRPDLVPVGQKLTATGITLFFWAALLYLWQPLLSLLAWGLNLHLFYNHMILLGGFHTFLHLLGLYLMVIAVLGGGLILWGRVNFWRFRGVSRRQGRGDTDMAKLCKDFGLEPEFRERAVSARVMTIEFAGNGQIAALIPNESVSRSLT